MQGESTSIPQAKTADPQRHSSYKYKYADLADVARAVYPITSKHGLSYIAKPTVNEAGQFVLAYALMHEAGSGKTASIRCRRLARRSRRGQLSPTRGATHSAL